MTVLSTPLAISYNSAATGLLVDTFGALKAEAADIATDLESIKGILIERSGEAKHEGALFRLAIAHSLASRTDWKSVCAVLAQKAGISDKVLDGIIAERTNLTDSWVARCSARVTKAA